MPMNAELSHSLQRMPTSRHAHHPPLEHRIDAVGQPPTADTHLMVVWTDKIEHAAFNRRGSAEPTIGTPKLWAKCERKRSRWMLIVPGSWTKEKRTSGGATRCHQLEPLSSCTCLVRADRIGKRVGVWTPRKAFAQVPLPTVRRLAVPSGPIAVMMR
jgi:hypothetical protein